MRFRGHSYRSLDSKARVILPPQFRKIVYRQDEGGCLMLTNFDGCVTGYPMEVWEEIEKSFDKVNSVDQRLRDFHRFFIAGAVEVEMDKQGRILIPPHLRSYAGLEREVVLAGVGNKFEIWDMGYFEKKRQYVEDNFETIIDSLAETGFELRI